MMENTLQDSSNEIRVQLNHLTNDIALLPSTKQHVQARADKPIRETERVGLKVNVDKCELTDLGTAEGGSTHKTVKERGVHLRLKKIWSNSITRRTDVWNTGKTSLDVRLPHMEDE